VQQSNHSPRIRKSIAARLPEGPAHLVSFDGLRDPKEHLAVVFYGRAADSSRPEPLVRIHSECLTGDVFGSCRCDCGPQLGQSLSLLSAEGGVLLYLRQEGRGIGLYNKLDAYALQDLGLNTIDANRALGFPDDARDYGCAVDMLRALGVTRLRLLTNNPSKVEALVEAGIAVEAVVPTGVYSTPENLPYLKAKRECCNHTIALDLGERRN
jgi:GTP cyclohydrolase II